MYWEGETDLHLATLLARSPDDPQRIRVASVFELFFVCLSVCLFFVCSLWANFLIFLLILLFYISVSYVIYWPAPPTIHRGLEWPQCLNCSLSA